MMMMMMMTRHWTHSLTPVQDFVWVPGKTNDRVLNYLCFSKSYEYLGVNCNLGGSSTVPICQKWNTNMKV